MWEHRIKIGKRRHEARSERYSSMEKQPGILSAPALNSCYCPGLPLLSEFPVPKSPKLEAWWPHQPRFQSGAESFCPVLPLHLIAWTLFLCGFRLDWWNTEMGLWVRGSRSQMVLFLDGKTENQGGSRGCAGGWQRWISVESGYQLIHHLATEEAMRASGDTSPFHDHQQEGATCVWCMLESQYPRRWQKGRESGPD